MTPQEKDLIESVFGRLRQAGVGAKDAEAEALIADRLRTTPDAAYGLTQAVVMLEAGLSQAQRRIADLERQVADARGAAPAAGGGFLGGASPFGGSVPRAGGGSVAPAAAVPAAAPAPHYAPQYQPQPSSPPQSGPFGGGGGFLRNAATMAMGVAGGTLIAQGLSSLFGGHGGYGFGGGGLASSPWGAAPSETVENVTVNNYYDNANGAADTQNAAFDDPSGGQDDGGFQDASYDDSSAGFDDSFDDGFGGGFDGSTDV